MLRQKIEEEAQKEWDEEHRERVNNYYGYLLGILILGFTFWSILPHLTEDGEFNRDEMGFFIVLIVLVLTASLPSRIKQIISIVLRRKNGNGGHDHA